MRICMLLFPRLMVACWEGFKIQLSCFCIYFDRTVYQSCLILFLWIGRDVECGSQHFYLHALSAYYKWLPCFADFKIGLAFSSTLRGPLSNVTGKRRLVIAFRCTFVPSLNNRAYSPPRGVSTLLYTGLFLAVLMLLGNSAL